MRRERKISITTLAIVLIILGGISIMLYAGGY